MICLRCLGQGLILDASLDGMVACPDCHARELERNGLLRRIESLQHSIDYAAPELEPYLQARRDKLLARLEELA